MRIAARRSGGGRAARARRRERTDVSRAQAARARSSPSPRARTRRYTVCKKKGRCDFRTIQKAVNKARAGDTIRVRNGVYREAVKVNGNKKRYLKLIGNPGNPEKVVLRASGNMQNGIFVNAANEVTVNGFMARDYKSNGFFFTNLHGYTMNHLIAQRTGVYGLYAFNTIGGRMINSEAYYVNDGAFYIGQTPPQAKPVPHDRLATSRAGAARSASAPPTCAT